MASEANHCHCGAKIRKNAKLCTLHAAEHGMQYATAPRVYKPKPKSIRLCSLPGCRKLRMGNKLAKYCCAAHRTAHAYIRAKTNNYEDMTLRKRLAWRRYYASIKELERRVKERTV